MRFVTRVFGPVFSRSCREMSRLISESRDRRLGPGERILLRFHLGMCDACRRYRQQVRFMSRAMGRWRRYTEE